MATDHALDTGLIIDRGRRRATFSNVFSGASRRYRPALRVLTRCLPLVAAAVASATLLPPGLLAQSVPQTGPTTSRPTSVSRVKEVVIPNDREEGGRPIELTLEDALRIGRRSNTNLAAAELLPLQSREDLRAARAFFEPELYGDIGAGKTESPTQNVFAPEITRETYQGTLGWRQRVASEGSSTSRSRRPRSTRPRPWPGSPRSSTRARCGSP
jgi:hypothetical protein